MLRARQRLGKYRIERRITNGPVAAVYQAFDSIHGIRVALKVPHASAMDEYFLADFKREARSGYAVPTTSQLVETMTHEPPIDLPTLGRP